ncbi:ubiquitin conjugation factor E4 A [Diorhabda carinulata]|uniref:ubiquitin conjugation factor E4 A n=1 Tax=Diorhabda carinulata TaxID=1163345 RepID=UPI0025A295AB|nr:ubiquitin conjugation factor E4 A [Diorhabda carinulata]
MSGSNPFSGLFDIEESKKNGNLNDILENIFRFTINPNKTYNQGLLYLEDVHNVHEKVDLDLSLLQYALFERLFLCNDNSDLRSDTESIQETKVITYLYHCMQNLNSHLGQLSSEQYEEVKDKILQNVATAIIQPDVYSGQNISEDILGILKNAEIGADVFFIESIKRVCIEDTSLDSLKFLVESINTIIVNELFKCSLTDVNPCIFNYFDTIPNYDILADVFIESCFPKKKNIGGEFALTVIGAILNHSVLPKTPVGKFIHFTNPMDQMGNAGTEEFLWVYLSKQNQHLHKFFLAMLKCSPKVKEKTLLWLGNCLHTNVNRGKIWNTHAPELNPAIYTSVTDGFMLNLSNLLLSLCQPFCSKTNDERVLKVDPTYCAVPNEDIEQKHIHMSDMSTETCFLPVSSDDTLEEKRLMANSYNFVTECFFMAHRSIDLGFRVGVDKLIRQNHEMGRIQRAFNEALQQAGGNSDLVGTIKDRMSDELTKYLSLKCALSDPDMLQKMFDLISATSYWLCQVSVHRHTPESTAYAPLKELPVNFPLDTRVPDTLKCIPEFLVENIVSFLVFIRRFSQKSFEEQGYDKLSPILTFILVYMGSRRHMKNPHVRARLAEALESLLPFHKDEPQGNNIGGAQRRMLFNEHPHKGRIVENLMNVFVEIEMTGQSVEFEQKFNYRRPMYAVFDYLWEIPEHLDSFRQLAEEAETNMEAVNPPLFLKFSNLLINDAIFLLDEALANMAKLKEMQQAQDSGEWANMNVRERTQNISYMHHIGNLARFDNILGKDTIGMLEKLTSRINLVFTHSTMVDRIAAMLNYFLLNLVGPNKKNFKVKDAKEYHFDPADTVLEICKIYVNLKESDNFCLAVSQDGRSYSPNLFSLAEDVLLRIGGGPLIGELKEVANKVAEKANEYMANEEVLSEAPEHFLDPIMSTLMMDPVILPSSKQIVDRSTIARHLLSDQTDPFNRSPLSMDQIIPHTELAEEIRNWIDERKRKAGSQS